MRHQRRHLRKLRGTGLEPCRQPFSDILHAPSSRIFLFLARKHARLQPRLERRNTTKSSGLCTRLTGLRYERQRSTGNVLAAISVSRAPVARIARIMFRELKYVSDIDMKPNFMSVSVDCMEQQLAAVAAVSDPGSHDRLRLHQHHSRLHPAVRHQLQRR